jgi:hypothetical protein
MRFRRSLLALSVVPVAALFAAPVSSSAASVATLKFGKNVVAYESPSYGEPGLADGTHGEVYVTTPGEGGAVWGRSLNSGKTFEKLPTVVPPSGQAGGVSPGSDSDVATGPDGTVYVGDLTIDGIEVSRSTDKGKTFPQQVLIHTGDTDREWLAVEGVGNEATVYCAWHELSTGTMLLAVSHDGGKTFLPPYHPLYSNPQTVGESAHNGTSIGGISIDGKGHVYISYGVTRLDTTSTKYGTPPISKIIVASSADHGATWRDVVVNPGFPDANYGNFWMATGVDRAGNVYATYAGRNHDATDKLAVYLQASKDHGTTWTEPLVVSPPVGNSLFAWVAGGGNDVAVVGWYHTDAPNKDLKVDWVVQMAQVRGLLAGKPRIIRGTASDHINHHGSICTLGIFCGVLPGSASDRSLLDFFKVSVDPGTGMAEVVFSDNAEGAQVTYARQVGGPSALDTGFSGGVHLPLPKPVVHPPEVAPGTAPPPVVTPPSSQGGGGGGSGLASTGANFGLVGFIVLGLIAVILVVRLVLRRR